MIVRTFVDYLRYIAILTTLHLFLDRAILVTAFVVARWMATVLHLLLPIFPPIISILRTDNDRRWRIVSVSVCLAIFLFVVGDTVIVLAC